MDREYTCKQCNKTETLKYKTYFYRIKYGTGKCNSCSKKGIIRKSHVAWNKGLVGYKLGHVSYFPDGWISSMKGKKHSPEALAKMRLSKLGIKIGVFSLEHRQKISQALKGKIGPKGENHWNWKKDRSTLVKRNQRNDSAYGDWRKRVWLRDNFKCKMANPDCSGRIEAHHILRWSEYPELRYEINNGITLCVMHHPRKRVEENNLALIFKELIRKE